MAELSFMAGGSVRWGPRWLSRFGLVRICQAQLRVPGQNLCCISTGNCSKKRRRLRKSTYLNWPALALNKQGVVERIHGDCSWNTSGKLVGHRLVKSDSQSSRPVEARSTVVRRSKVQERSDGVKPCFIGFINPAKQGSQRGNGPLCSSLHTATTK